MEFNLTASQRNFYTRNDTIDSTLWNQGVMQVFPKRYSYKQLNDAYNKLVKSNDSLRITMKKTNDGHVMCLKEFEYTEYPFWSLSSEKELMSVAQEFLNEPIDLYGILVKCAVFETPTSSGIMISGHHTVVDGYSAFVMAEHINNYLLDPDFLPVNQSYREYIESEEKHKLTKRFISDEKFWLEKFSQKPVCALFTEQASTFDYTSSEVNCKIPRVLFNNIKEFCSDNSISVQTYFNTIYAAYIHRKFNFDNFTMGVPVLNRATAAELNTIGLYMHVVPLVIQITDESFLDHALRIEDSQLTLFRHQKFTQHNIKEVLKNNDFQINQLFDFVCDYQEFKYNENYEMRLPYSNSLSIPIELHLQSFSEERINLKIRYRTSYFTEKEVEIMMNSIINIAEDALKNPHKKINELEILSFEEKQKLINTFNDTAHSYAIPEKTTLYSLFEKTAKENPQKTCVSTAEKTLTFGELLTISENLDAKIRSITHSNKGVIAVLTERSIEMYSAIYGIIRGGNAYLPIDPDYPQERIEYILKNSNAAAVVTQEKFVHLAGNTPCINMTDFIIKEFESTDTLPCLADENDTAYVIYTSGSTGNPKGAKVSHKSAINRILWMHDKYPLLNNDVILQKTPYTFDVSVWELFWWGICGGSLAASKPGEHFLPSKILDETFKNKVTHLHFVPSVFELFLNYLEEHKEEIYKFNSVKYVFLSGEALTSNLVKRFYSLFSCNNVTIHNLYGPTECAVDVTYYDCLPTDIDPVPIGKPIYNTQMYVVDKNMNIQPIGVKGELCIGGINVGQGYLNNAELTSQKFVDNPFGEGKLYKTGDLAYWNENGQIIFSGRIDTQIKLNGQRIEIGEIESVINSINSVESVAVVVSKVNTTDTLVAFYTGKPDSEAVIKEICLKKLPKYMVPAVIVHLDKLPLNQSGKLDRKNLSQRKIALNPVLEDDEPTNDTEKFICEVFKRTLEKTTIGRNSDFFENGGTSLSMITLLSENGFEDISSSEFIRNSTPSKLAILLNEKKLLNTEYLEPLYLPDNAMNALILLPFAGGGSEAYSNLVTALKQKEKQTAIYFVRYLHSFDECKNAAKEISRVIGKKKISLYSHCVGSALALQILKVLEEDGAVIKHYFAGASIPPAKPTEKNIWNSVPNKMIKFILSKAGAQFNELSDKKADELLERFIKDTDFANISYAEFNSRIKVPVTVIISKKDIFTLNYKKTEKIWKKYVETLNNILFIDSNNHYFQATDCEELAKILSECK